MKHLLAPLLLAACCSSASAATIAMSIQLDARVPFGTSLVPGGVLLGSIGYDPAKVSSVGTTILYPENDSSLALSFVLDGAAFDETHDTAANYPAFQFTNGILTAISFWAANHHHAADADGFVQIETAGGLTKFYYGFDARDEYTGTVQWGAAAIPEPSAATLCLLAAGLIFRRRICH